MRFALLLIPALELYGCGAAVLHLAPTAADAAPCTEAGDVIAEGTSPADALASARERAANRGASHVLVVEIDADPTRSYAYGRGFTCPEKED